jgi:hypothetical protein
VDNPDNQVVVPIVGTPENQPAPVVQPAPQPEVAALITVDVGNTAFNAAIASFATSAKATDADIQRAIGVAMERGDASLIDKAFIAEKFGANAEAFATIAESAVQESAQRVVAQKAAVDAAVVEVAGSPENWQKHVAAFNETAPEHIQKAAKAMLDGGFLKEGMKFVMEQVGGSVLSNTGNLIGGLPSSQSAGLTAQEFKDAQQALMKEAGNRSLEHGPLAEKFQALIKQRELGLQNGR